MDWAGHLPEAAFRRHAPGCRMKGLLWGPSGGVIRLPRTEVSSPATYISLIGQSRVSAFINPWNPLKFSVATFCVMREKMQLPITHGANFSLHSHTGHYHSYSFLGGWGVIIMKSRTVTVTGNLMSENGIISTLKNWEPNLYQKLDFLTTTSEVLHWISVLSCGLQ